MNALEGIWFFNEAATQAGGGSISITLHIRSPDAAGVQHGYLVRTEALSGGMKKISLPILIDILPEDNKLRLSSHKREIVDELSILSLERDRLTLQSTLNNQTIKFKKETK